MLTKVKGPTDLFEDVYPPVDIVDTSTKEWADETAEKYVAVPLNDPITIKDLCETIPLSRWINSVPIPMTLMDDAWKKAHPYPTPIDYYLLYEDKHYKDLSDVKRSASNVEFPKERDWIDIGSVNIATFGTQRIQFQNREATPKLFKRAVNFDHTLTSIQTAKLDSTDFPQLKDACFVTNGAGTLCSAYLRGERRIAATIVNVTSEEELENLFFEVDGSKVKISAFEKYKTKLAMGDPFARLQDRVMDDAGVTPLKNHPDDLWYTDLSPLAKGLKGKFDNDESSSISGDSRKQVQDTNLFVTRKARNIVDTYELMMSVWADDGSKQIHSSLFGALLAFKATGNGMVTVKKLETRMIYLKRR